MRNIRVLMATILLFPAVACHEEKSKDNEGPALPPPTTQTASSAPVVALGLNGGLAAGSIPWTLPDFLKDKFQDLGKANVETALDIDLVHGTDRKSAKVNTGFTVKACDPAAETSTFLANVAKRSAENVPPSLKLDVDEVSSWTAESKSFKGRLFLRKSYKSQGDTGIYRIDALVTNTQASECVLWNLVFTPAPGTSAAFIEGSEAYKALLESLSKTWEGLGADMVE